MSDQLMVKNDIYINAPASKVWDVLTNPQQTKKYMFGCETVSDWKPGSPLLWRMNHEGRELVAVKGSIVEIEPNKHLAYTTIDPNNPAMEDKPENYLTVTYTLKEENEGTKLEVSQGDYSKVADGQKRYEDTNNNGEGWNPVLVQIKKIAEEE